MATDRTSETDRARETRGMEHLAGKYITFKLASEEYAFSILNVREIIGLMDITRVPRTPEFVRGVINLRGKVHPVVDLRIKFGMPGTEPTDQTVIIVVQCLCRGAEQTMGILVDEVLEVLSIKGDQIEPPPTYSGAAEARFILGVGKAGKRVIFLLDIGEVLDAGEIAAVTAAAN